MLRQFQLLLPDGGVPWPPLVLDGLLVHPHLETSPEPASSALVTMGLVNDTLLTLSTLAPILSSSPDGAFEEASTSITGKDAIMFARTEVSTHFARHVIQDTAAAARTVHKLRWTVVVEFQTNAAIKVACYLHGGRLKM